jgi:hypothetical protein
MPMVPIRMSSPVTARSAPRTGTQVGAVSHQRENRLKAFSWAAISSATCTPSGLLCSSAASSTIARVRRGNISA